MSGYLYPKARINRNDGSRKARIEAAVLEEIDALDGQVTTVRFLYYRLVSRGIIEKGRKYSTDVSKVVTYLRDTGLIPMGQIVDRGRQMMKWTVHGSMEEAIRRAVERARLDPWRGRTPPQLWVESDSLAGWLEQTAYEYAVPIVPLKGQSSRSFDWEVASTVDKDTTILYVGDWNRSGFDIQHSFIERVSTLARVQSFLRDHDDMQDTDVAEALLAEGEPVVPWRLDVQRVAVTTDQVDEYALPVVYERDGRDGKLSESVEAEALPQQVLLDLIVETLVAEGIDLERAAEADEQRQEWLARLDG